MFFSAEQQLTGVQGTMPSSQIASPEPQRAVVESGVNIAIFSSKGYGEVPLQFGELTIDYRGRTTRDQPGSLGRDECCQGMVLHDDADLSFLKTR